MQVATSFVVKITKSKGKGFIHTSILVLWTLWRHKLKILHQKIQECIIGVKVCHRRTDRQIQCTIYAEIVETTLVISRFSFLRVGFRISELHVIILPRTQILQVGSRISDCSWFCFSYLKFYVAPSRITWPGATRNDKKPIRNCYLEFISDLLG